jgi:hypothetical protein
MALAAVCNVDSNIYTSLHAELHAMCCTPALQGFSLTPKAQSRAEALLYQGISPAETHQLLALLVPSQPHKLSSSCTSSPGQQQQQQQQQQMGKPGEAAVALAAEACSRPLAQQLKQLVSLCEEEFEQPLVAISPSVAPPVAQLQLLPSAAGAAASGGGLQASSSSSSSKVAVGPPLLQPQQVADLHSYVCCAVPAQIAAAAAAAAEGQMLLVVQLPREGLAQQQAAVKAVLLQLLEGQSAIAWQFYKGQQLVLLVGGSSAEDVEPAAGKLAVWLLCQYWTSRVRTLAAAWCLLPAVTFHDIKPLLYLNQAQFHQRAAYSIWCTCRQPAASSPSWKQQPAPD